MSKSLRCVLGSIVLVIGLLAGGTAHAAVTGSTGTNVQSGNNRATTTQGGQGKSGSAVGGQVTGVVSSGRTSVDAKNTSTNSDVTSGEVNGSNTSNSFVGLDATHSTTSTPSGGGAFASAAAVISNLQDGNNTLNVRQTSDATSGDGVAGQVIGAVTTAGGSSSIVASNTTDNVDVTTGEARSANNSTAFVGLEGAASATALNLLSTTATNVVNCTGGATCNPTQNNSTTTAIAATATAVAIASNTQTGDNRATVSQSAPSTSGDGVAGQVIGAVSGGASSIDATNHSTNSSVETGSATSNNAADTFSGLDAIAHATATNQVFATQSNSVTCSGTRVTCSPTQINAATITATIRATSNATATNNQTGNNRATVSQSAPATTGDGVAGEVIGAVTSPGGSSSIVAANTSDNVDVTTGDAKSSNSADPFVGLRARAASTAANLVTATQTNSVVCVAATDTVCSPFQRNAAIISGTISAVSAASPTNTQTGDNRAVVSQSAPASSGDGVAGQVIGAVSAGSSSIDATNHSTNSSVQTGDATSANTADPFVGLRTDASVVDGNFIQAAHQSNNVNCSFSTSTICNPTQINVATVTGTIAATATAAPTNTQTGDNRATVTQSAPASSGDGVAGEVIGAVTSAGGRSSIVAANTSDNVDVRSGDAKSSNDSNLFVGLQSDATLFGLNSSRGSQSNSTTCVFTTGVTCSPFESNRTTITATVASTATAAPANDQTGSNRATLSQSAPASTGDGVAGQVIGAVSAGASSIDATNTSKDSSVQTGDASSSNSSGSFVGLDVFVDSAAVNASNFSQVNNCTSGTCIHGSTVDATITAVSAATPSNHQTGNNRATLSQSAPASTGDGVAGQIIGAVTSAGGSSSIVAANTSDAVDVTTGDAKAANSSDSFVGLSATGTAAAVNLLGGANVGDVFVADSTSIQANAISDPSNHQNGDNRLSGAQTATASTGNGVGGQVIGAVSAGATSIDATNTSKDSSVQSGDSNATNDAAFFVGLRAVSETFSGTLPPISGGVLGADLTGVTGTNLQDGDNTKTFSQTASAVSGDGVAGQVTGVVTSAGGSASVVLANTSTGIDSTSGDSRFANADRGFVGLTFASVSALLTRG